MLSIDNHSGAPTPIMSVGEVYKFATPRFIVILIYWLPSSLELLTLWVDGWWDGGLAEWVDGWMDGWMGGRMDQWMGAWVIG